MAKLQRNPTTGKIVRGANGKILAYDAGEPCCCEPPEPPPDCGSIWDDDCLLGLISSGFMPDTWQAVAVSISICPGCIDTGGASYQISGSPNRTYILGGDTANQGVRSSFFTAAATSAPGALSITRYSDPGCTGTATVLTEYTVAFDVQDGGGGVQIVAGGIDLVFGGSLETTQGCEEESVVENDLTSCGGSGTAEDPDRAGHSGTITFTPCPPCALDCEPSLCATAELTQDSEDPGIACSVSDFEGEYSEPFRGHWSRFLFAFVPPYQVPPVGCYWRWTKRDGFSDDEVQRIYVWYDGQDFRGIATEEIDGVETPRFYSGAAADITCTDGTLAGTIELKGSFDTEGEPRCTILFTLGDCAVCPVDCEDCCDTYEVDTAGVFDFEGPTTLTRNVGGAGTCHWSGINAFSSGTVTITCADGYWYMEFDQPDTSNVVMRASASTPCPPTSPGAWSLFSNVTGGSPDAEITDIITSDCPP